MEEVHDPSMVPDQPLTIASYPRAIVHIDGDAFFASCEQARGKSYPNGRANENVRQIPLEW
jgi:hypothetical protein